jgi:hypothetical protein
MPQAGHAKTAAADEPTFMNGVPGLQHSGRRLTVKFKTRMSRSFPVHLGPQSGFRSAPVRAHYHGRLHLLAAGDPVATLPIAVLLAVQRVLGCCWSRLRFGAAHAIVIWNQQERVVQAVVPRADDDRLRVVDAGVDLVAAVE